MAVQITTGEFRFGNFRFVFRMSPVWDKMAREFEDIATSILSKEMENVAREMGKEMLRNIKKFALPHSFTGRLADARVPAHGGTWRYWISPPGFGGGATGLGWHMTVGLHQPESVSPAVGRPVSMYASAIEFGAKPSYPLGKQARLRIKSWAMDKGMTATQAHRIARAIYLRGTRAQPYFEPAARATAQGALGWLEEGGTNWQSRVEAYFAG